MFMGLTFTGVGGRRKLEGDWPGELEIAADTMRIPFMAQQFIPCPVCDIPLATRLKHSSYRINKTSILDGQAVELVSCGVEALRAKRKSKSFVVCSECILCSANEALYTAVHHTCHGSTRTLALGAKCHRCRSI